jgi:hypothetical protein
LFAFKDLRRLVRYRLKDLATLCLACVIRPVSVRSVDGFFSDETDIRIGQDVQLKILQTLPALLQNYSGELHDELLSNTLNICATLQASKTAAVANTAAATLQQLVVSAFEKVTIEDGALANLLLEPSF